MVRAASELESKYGRDGRRGDWDYCPCVERECREGGADKVSRKGTILSKSMVSDRLGLRNPLAQDLK